MLLTALPESGRSETPVTLAKVHKYRAVETACVCLFVCPCGLVSRVFSDLRFCTA